MDNLILWNDDINFNKTTKSISSISKKAIDKMYNFLNAKLGDILYKDPNHGYNLIGGNIVGECCVEAGEIDEYPRFWAKDEEHPMPMSFGEIDNNLDFSNIIVHCDVKKDINGYDHTKCMSLIGLNTSLITDEHGEDFYIPSVGELYAAKQHNNLLQYKLEPDFYWTTTAESILYRGDDYLYVYYVYGDGEPSSKDPEIDGCSLCDENRVKMFIKVNNPESVNEASLLLMRDNDTILFSKSSQEQTYKINVAKQILENCEVGDFVYQVAPYKYTISKTLILTLLDHEIGMCCIGGDNQYGPCFAYKEITNKIPLYKHSAVGPNPEPSVKHPDGYTLTHKMAEYKFAEAANFIENEMSNSVKSELYIPSMIELKTALENINTFCDSNIWHVSAEYDKYICNLSYRAAGSLWTSSEANSLYAIAISTINKTATWELNRYERKIVPFIHIEYSNLLLNDLNEDLNNNLLSLDNDDIEFLKSKLDQFALKKVSDKISDFKTDLKLEHLKKVNLGDGLYYNDNNHKYIIVNVEDSIKEDSLYKINGSIAFIKSNPKIKYKLIGSCCVTSEQIQDGLPRFKYNISGKKSHMNYVWDNTLGKPVKIEGLLQYDDVSYMNDIFGYENTQIIKKYKTSLAESLLDLSDDIYIPAIGELVLTLKNNKFGKSDCWSSSYCSPYQAFYISETWGKQHCDKDRAMHVLPFIHVTIDNIVIPEINESLLILFNDGEIEFNKSSNTLDRSSKKVMDILYDFKNCVYGDKLYYDDKIGYNLIDGKLHAICCIPAGQIDGYPRFMYKSDVDGPPSYGDLYFVMDCDNEPLTSDTDDDDKTRIMSILEDIQYSNNHDYKCGYVDTYALAAKNISPAAFEVINYSDTNDDYLYIPSSYELCYACSNGISSELENGESYLTCSYIVDEWGNEGDDDYFKFALIDVLKMSDQLKGKDVDFILNTIVESVDVDNGTSYRCRPFFNIIKLINEKENKHVNESFDFNKALMSFDDNEIEFNKSLNTLANANKKALDLLYGFNNCLLGDIVYNHPDYGYNLVDGEPIAECCIVVGNLDKRPRFWALSDLDGIYEYHSKKSVPCSMFLGMMDMDPSNANWSDNHIWKYYGPWLKDNKGRLNTEILLNSKKSPMAIEVKKLNKDFYVPSANELITAAINMDGTSHMILKDLNYWSSTQFAKQTALSIHPDELEKGPVIEYKTYTNFIRPFLFIPINYAGKSKI